MNTINQKSLAEHLDISESYLSLIMSGNREISKKLCRRINQQTGLSYESILNDSAYDIMFAAWQIINQLKEFRGEA